MRRSGVSVRVLCHDTQMSHSLLGQLGLLATLRFVDTTPPDLNPLPDAGEIVVHEDGTETHFVTLFSSSLAPMGGGPHGLVPRHEVGPWSEPKPFDAWWNATILRAPNVNMSRRDIVLALANWDGGAHVDPEIKDADYGNLSRGGALGTFGYVKADGESVVVDTNPALPVMRQIAFEVLKTLEPVVGPIAIGGSPP